MTRDETLELIEDVRAWNKYRIENPDFVPYLIDAHLHGANLRGADLHGADLIGADLRYAHLHGANLIDADLRYAHLHGANLSRADLHGADLIDANLRYAHLHGANLSGADLRYAKLPYFQIPEGDLTVWKKGEDGLIKLLIPEKAKRTANLRNRKCRAEYAKVLGIWDFEGKKMKESRGHHDLDFIYKVGKTVKPDKYCDDIRLDCSNGIHFFLTKQEAEDW